MEPQTMYLCIVNLKETLKQEVNYYKWRKWLLKNIKDSPEKNNVGKKSHINTTLANISWHRNQIYKILEADSYMKMNMTFYQDIEAVCLPILVMWLERKHCSEYSQYKFTNKCVYFLIF